MEPTRPPIIRRRVKIDFDAAPSGAWRRGGRLFEDMLNAVSFLLPVGEKFFIDSLRPYLPRITDPVLREQAEQFIYQEVMHSREHGRSNAILRQIHAYGPLIERMTTIILTASRYTPKATQLAATCALEHFTAILSDALLRHQDAFRAQSDPAFATLWLWHAVEETEHKAVCFDVYEHVYGKGFFAYLHRVLIMAGVTAIISTTMLIAFAAIPRPRRAPTENGVEAPPRPGLSSLAQWIPRGMYRDYYRRSFHPWDHDNMALVDEWKRHYADLGIVPPTAAA